ncbi:expansin EXLX1 family cellulose-binding protein [Streptomyces capitiformicae]|uniref:expansin EXLX1 family cellulose-binding protein n=1 Tax=Streptomyces capitiformicae TaxID=2014920 RepID=UPI001E3DF063|nr:expansin EXLX1 family cellulose-binding protein [Streptomyces capitiformicae]
MAFRSHRSSGRPPRHPSRPSRRRPTSHPSRPKWRAALVSVIAVAAIGLVVSLVMALSPGRETDAGEARAAGDSRSARDTPGTPAAGARASAPQTAPEQTPSTTPTPTKGKKPPKATPTPKPTPPAAQSTPQSGSAAAPLVGRIRPNTTYEGVATFYDAGNGDGACLYGPTSDVMTAAMNHTDYETSKACGAYVRVRAASGASVTVRITNECPLPCAPGQLDLSAQAFAKLAAPSRGQIPITWSLLSPDTSDTISVRYKTGSSRYWCGIQVIGHRNPVARLEVRAGGGWRQLPRTEYNYFLAEDGNGCGSTIRITDIHGERLTVDGITVRPNTVQPTKVQFSKR